MHMMKTYENLCPKLERELVEINNKGDWTREDVEDLHHILKSLYLCEQLKEKEMMYEEGQSGYYNGSYGMRMPNIPNMSWGRDGDGDGRYNESSRNNFRNSSYRGSYGSEYGQSNTNRKLVGKLAEAMDTAVTDKERMAIENCIDNVSK